VLPVEVLIVEAVEPGRTKAGFLVVSVVEAEVDPVADEIVEEVVAQAVMVTVAVAVAVVAGRGVATGLLDRSWRGSSASITNSPAIVSLHRKRQANPDPGTSYPRGRH
jgi:hypothetical protein